MTRPSGEGARRDRLTLAALLPLMIARHAALYYHETEFPHFEALVEGMRRLEAGDLTVRGPELWDLDLGHAGPLHYLLHYPARLVPDPLWGIHLLYGLLEALALGLWLRWSRLAAIDAPVRRAAALVLALAAGTKMVVCENMTIATYLTLPVFPLLLVAARRRSVRAVLGPSVLLGAAAAVHAAVLLLLPGALATLWWPAHRRSRPALRSAVLAGGVVAMVLLLGAGRDDGAGASLADAAARLVDNFSTASFVQVLLVFLPVPLTPVGLAVLARGCRSGEPAPDWLIPALLWLGPGYLLLSLAISFVGEGFHVSRLAVLLPARTLLAAVGLLWLVDAMGASLRRAAPGLPRVSAVHAVVAVAGAVGLYLVGDAAAGRAMREAEYSEERRAPCFCLLWMRQTDMRFLRPTLDEVRPCLAALAGGRPVALVGPMSNVLDAHLFWTRRSGPLGLLRGEQPGTGDATPVAVLPAMANMKLGDLPGARTCGPLVFVPALRRAAPATGGGHRRFQLPPPHGHRPRLLMATATGENSFQPPQRVALSHAGRDHRPIARCECHLDHPMMENYTGTFLFELPAAAPNAPHHHDLSLQHARGDLRAAELLELPRRCGRNPTRRGGKSPRTWNPPLARPPEP